MDKIAVRDPTSPSRWRMRSSYHAAVKAYERALELLPSAYAGYEHDAFDGLRPLLLVKTRLIAARAASPDTGQFLARLALLGDTLALIPYPWSVISMGGPEAVPPGFLAAQANRTTEFRKLTSGWSAAFPNRAGPKHAVAIALEMLGDPRAIDTLLLARRLATDPERKALLASAEVLVRVKFASPMDRSAWQSIRSLADSLLSAGVTSSEHASALGPLTVLLGRCDLSEALSRLERSVGLGPVTQALADAADLHMARAAIGCSVGNTVPSLADLGALVDQETRAAGREVRRFVSAFILQRPTLVSWPIDSAVIGRIAELNSDQPLLRAVLALSRGDVSAARTALAAFSAQSVEALAPSSDVSYPAARLYATAGDTAGAIALLDQTLGGLRSYDPWQLGDRVVTAGLVRAMVLRADLAFAVHDVTTVRRWAGIVSVLWSGADDDLQPVVRRMKRYVALN
jgi:hypothetical protein